jgi:tetratricopeptide (TPR) repeat protein
MRRIAAAAWLLLAVGLPARSLAQSINPPSMDSLERSARADSLDADTRYELGLAYLRNHRYNDAETELHVAIRLDPRLAPAHLGLAVVQDQNRDYWNALKHQGGDSAVAREHRDRAQEIRRAFLLDPLVDIQVLAYAEHNNLPRGMSWGGYESAFLYADALETVLLRRQPAFDSLPPGLMWMHGLLSAHTGRFDLAIKDEATLVRVLERRETTDSLRVVPLPTNEVRYLLAAIQQRAGNREQAIALYREVLERDVGNYMAQVQLARVHEDGQEWSQAVAARRAAIAANPDDPTLQLDLAATLIGARFPARAESVLVDAGPTLSRDPRLYYILGRAEQAQNKRDEAREAFQTFLTLAPRRWESAVADARRRIEELSRPPQD